MKKTNLLELSEYRQEILFEKLKGKTMRDPEIGEIKVVEVICPGLISWWIYYESVDGSKGGMMMVGPNYFHNLFIDGAPFEEFFNTICWHPMSP